MRRWAGWAAGVVTFALALVGAYTGLSDWLDDRRVTLRLSAERYSGPVGGPIRVGILNRSRRGVSFREGSVRAEGRRIGRVTGIVLDPALLDPARHSAAELRAASRPLPVAVDGEQALAGAIVWEAVPDQQTVEQLLFEPPSGPRPWPLHGVPLNLELRFEPGEVQTVRVPAVLWPAGAEATASVLERPPWRASLRVRGDAVTAVELRRAIDRFPAVATLDVWRQAARRVARSVTRPVTGTSPAAAFPLGRLDPGTYVWAIRVEGQTVASGVFDTPCPGSLLGTDVDPLVRCTPRTPPFSRKEPGLR
jgi:hypothetical protein